MDETVKTRNQIITAGSFSTPIQGTFFIPRDTIVPEQVDQPVSQSYLGTPIYSSLIFKAVTDSDEVNLPTDVAQIVSEDLELTEVLVTVSQSKNIVRTPLNGRPGTVKEYISKGDYNLLIEGVVVSQTSTQLPRNQIKQIASFLDLEQSLEVGSTILSLFGITKIVVMEYRFDEIEGSVNQMSFRLNLLSDTDFKIEPTQDAVT